MFVGLSWPRIGTDYSTAGKHQRLLTEENQEAITYV